MALLIDFQTKNIELLPGQNVVEFRVLEERDWPHFWEQAQFDPTMLSYPTDFKSRRFERYRVSFPDLNVNDKVVKTDFLVEREKVDVFDLLVGLTRDRLLRAGNDGYARGRRYGLAEGRDEATRQIRGLSWYRRLFKRF